MGEIVVSPGLSALWKGSVGGKIWLLGLLQPQYKAWTVSLFFSHFLDEGRLGGLRTEIMQTW